MAGPNSYNLLDVSGAMQNATSHLIRKRIEVFNSINAVYNRVIGAASRRFGYEQVGQVVQYGNDSLYGGVYLYGSSNKIIVGINTDANDFATLRYLDSDNYYKPMLYTTPNMRFQCLNYLDEFYVAGKGGGQYQVLTNIDSTLTASTTRNVLNAPQCKFIAQYGGQLYAINCQVNGVTYRDRAYLSSPPLGVVTQVQNAVSGWATQIHVDSVRYLKVGMTIDIYGAQTTNLLVPGLVIVSVDKLNNMIGFSGVGITVNANDEVWISGRFGLLTTLWNTDYPTPQTSDWIRIPPGEDETAEFTGWTVNNNRLLLFSKNSLLKWDGTNLILLSQSVGTVSHESICNIGSWTIWLHTSGVWGYNDTTGQFKMISKSINPLIKRINPSSLDKVSAVLSNRTYRLSLGTLMDSTLQTTSTSTSSTSTSSTTTSTSSTSTSSTSASSITTTTTNTTTTIATTSTSTSSTSSTSTTTVPTNVQSTVLAYDFDLNIWWTETYNREHRFQFIHQMNGYTKPYFTDNNGYLFRGETGLTDFGASIPMIVEFGRNNLGTEQSKAYLSVQIDSENARGGIIQYSLDGGDFQTLGQIKDDVETLVFPQKAQLVQSRDIDFQFVHNDYGDPPVLNGITVWFNVVETIVNELGEHL